ncbi:carbohydrate kinase family protein [Alloactinosynnema sp. L-07]|uniref:carbohydrate kinase family protein n=1 Tax=Alloactinosynnema sp. L-07 TaxID=1653480 RepID=UPI0006B52546|nr:sugar kinase [Alloactinosynnema sp. L-07]
MTVVVLGDAALDVVVRPSGPIAFGDDTRASITRSMGGAGANTAAWLAHLGTDVVLVSRVGADSAGAQLEATLTAAGVRCAFTVDPEAATGGVVVLIDEEGRRTMLSDRGANARLQAADLDPALLADARHLHLSGYVLLDESSRQAGVDALAAAKSAGLTTSVDPQAAAMIDDATVFLDCLRGVDLLLPNADELRALGGQAVLRVVGAVAVTDGEHGASWLSPDTTESVAAPAVECVDSTGAGDAFDAGVLTAWLGGASPRESLLAGVAAGSEAVRRIGARPPGQPSIT